MIKYTHFSFRAMSFIEFALRIQLINVRKQNSPSLWNESFRCQDDVWQSANYLLRERHKGKPLILLFLIQLNQCPGKCFSFVIMIQRTKRTTPN